MKKIFLLGLVLTFLLIFFKIPFGSTQVTGCSVTVGPSQTPPPGCVMYGKNVCCQVNFYCVNPMPGVCKLNSSNQCICVNPGSPLFCVPSALECQTPYPCCSNNCQRVCQGTECKWFCVNPPQGCTLKPATGCPAGTCGASGSGGIYCCATTCAGYGYSDPPCQPGSGPVAISHCPGQNLQCCNP